MITETDYRRKAEECWQQAERSVLPHDKALWVRLAQQWEKLAESREATGPAGQPRPPKGDKGS